jgi:hypothetical protein
LGVNYNKRIFDFVAVQAGSIENDPLERSWIESQLQRTSILSSYLYLWSEDLRQKGGNLESARAGIVGLEEKIYGVKELIDGKRFPGDTINRIRELAQQREDQTLGEFYEGLNEDLTTEYGNLTAEKTAPVHHTVLTDLRVLKGVREDIDAGRVRSITQLRDNLYALAGVDLIARKYLEETKHDTSNLSKAGQVEEGLLRAGKMIDWATPVKARLLKLRISAAERGISLLPGDTSNIEQLRKDYSRFTTPR